MDSERKEDLVAVITWALDRILNGNFAAVRDAAGQLDSLVLDKDISRLRPGIDLGHAEANLKNLLPGEKFRALVSLKDRRTPNEIESVLRLILPPSVAARGAWEMDGAEWPDVLMFVDANLMKKSGHGEKIGEWPIKGREGFNPPVDPARGSNLGEDFPAATSVFTARKYAKEIRSLFPKIIGRASSLCPLPAAGEVPEYVQRYLMEASRCYIYGHFLASLFLCRSALGEAVVVGLRKEGYAKEIAEINEEGLKGVFRLARSKGLMDETLHHQADAVRALANQAIQGGKLPTADECRNAFDLTWGILQRLYA